MPVTFGFALRVGSLWVAYAFMIAANALAPSVPLGTPVGRLSDANRTFLTPSGYTFSVWGIIYTMHAIFLVYQSRPVTHRSSTINAATPYIIWSFLVNGVWLPIFQYKFYWLSFLVLAINVALLVEVYRLLRVCAADRSYIEALAFSAFSVNLGWVTLATAVNFSIALLNSGWTFLSPDTGVGSTAAGVDWAVLWLAVVGVISAYLCAWRADVAHAAVTLWGVWGVHSARTKDVDVDRVQATIVVLTIVLPLALVLGFVNRRLRWWGHAAHRRDVNMLLSDARSLAVALRTLATLPDESSEEQRDAAQQALQSARLLAHDYALQDFESAAASEKANLNPQTRA